MSHKRKFKISIIRPIATYTGQTMYLIIKGEKRQKIFQRKIVETMKTANREYRKLMNYQITVVMGGESIVKIIKAQRLTSIDHKQRKENEILISKVTRIE